MLTLDTEKLTHKYRTSDDVCLEEDINIDKKKDSETSSIWHWFSALVAIPYGVCYGFLTYTLLNYSAELFLNALIQTVFFIVIPAWTLIIPAVLTGSIYWLIGQHELNESLRSFANQKDNKNNSYFKSLFLIILGGLVGLFIGLEFFEFLPFMFPVAVAIAIFGGSTHFTVFYNNASNSINELSKLFDITGGEYNIEYLLNMISLVAPILAIVHIIFITGLFNPIVPAFFAIGVLAVFVKKWMNYSGLNIFSRFYASIDATIREYTALIIHCIGEGAIPAAAATHSSSSTGIFFAQLSGLVATSNEYFTDLHAVAGDKHFFRVSKYYEDNIYLCEVSEDESFIDIDKSQSFFFQSMNSSNLNKVALMHLNDQFNGVFEYCDSDVIYSGDYYQLDNKYTNRYQPASFMEAILGVKLKNKINYFFYLCSFLYLTSSLSLIALFFLNIVPLAITVFSLIPLFMLYRFSLVYFCQLKEIPLEFNAFSQSVQCGCQVKRSVDQLEDEGHSHGLDYKPVINFLFGFSTRVKSHKVLQNNFGDSLNKALWFLSLCIMALSMYLVSLLTIGTLHQVLLIPLFYLALTQCVNLTTWLFSTTNAEKKLGIHVFISQLFDPSNWLKVMGYFIVFLVAFCIGINGGTEFAFHLSFMFATSPVVLPMVISIFVICALLTEGVWINDRLEKSLSPIKSYFFKPEPIKTDNKAENKPENVESSKPFSLDDLTYCQEIPQP
ncbi:MAG: hypothetical protein VX835_00605 [Pseudomonadota bacterium]|nr:hypothetical protein [Pseudomonadota bacterium]